MHDYEKLETIRTTLKKGITKTEASFEDRFEALRLADELLAPYKKPNQAPSTEPLFDTKDAAAYLALGPRTLIEWRVRGGGPQFTKLNRAVRYRRADLDAFVAERLRHSTSDPGT